MKCPNCGGQMGLEDAVCPYCGTPNAQATQHQSDMARFRREYQRTQADVMKRTSLMQKNGSWLVILTVLLVVMVVGIILNVFAWDIGSFIRESSAKQTLVQDHETLDSYLESGDYGKFVGFYEANDINMDYDNRYQVVYRAAYGYVDLIQYVGAKGSSTSYAFMPEHLSDTCTYIAEDLNRIYTIEQEYARYGDKFLPADMRVYLDDMKERAGVIAHAYFGLSDEDVREIPNMSTKKLATLIEEGIQS